MKKILYLLTLIAILCFSACDGAFDATDDQNEKVPAECSHVWREATCDAPKMCRKCEETVGEALGHSWIEATCDTAKRCETCRKTEGSALGHNWDREILCTDPAVCTVCEATSGKATDHVWKEATCEQPESCKKCTATQGEALGHYWRGGSCKELAVCDYCYKKADEYSEHDWSGAYCTSDNVCYTCGEVKEAALGHDWIEADCTNPKRCSRCRESIGNPLKHQYDYTQNLCTVCNDVMVESFSDLSSWLFRDFQTIETAIGTLKLTGSQMSVFPLLGAEVLRTHDYDIIFYSSIYIDGVNMTLMEAVVKADHIPYEDRIQAVIDVLKAEMKIAEMITKALPGKKCEIKFFEEGYSYPWLELGYFSSTQLSWRNFTPNQSGLSGYDSTDLCEWFIDAEGFLNSTSFKSIQQDILAAWQEYGYELYF